MAIDLRTRFDTDYAHVDAHEFFDVELPARFEAEADTLAHAAAHLRLEPFAIETPAGTWSLNVGDGGHFAVDAGDSGRGAHARLTDLELTDLVTDQATPISFMTSGALDMARGHIGHFLDWWLVIRSALDGRPVYVPGDVELTAADGAELDLSHTFGADDDDVDMRDFLERAGYLHIAGVFDADEMGRIADDMDAAAPTYSPGDGNSWWAKNAAGEELLVRMQRFAQHSPTTAALMDDARLARIAGIAGCGHVMGTGRYSESDLGIEGNWIEALVKPVEVVEGISDVPWHKDCSLGRHSYECCSLTVGISVTGADAESGQLHAVAGSHRALIRPSLLDIGKLGLPDVALPTRTGDVTMHLSCTLHMAQPPVARERRVLYTSFRLPPRDAGAAAEARARLRAARESAPLTVDQPSAV